MTLKNSFDRLHFTISNQNKPNQTDADAFAIICENYKQQQTAALNNNKLFAKLYALTLCEFLKYYTDIDFANEKINKILAEPLDLRLLLLQDALKTNQIYTYFKQKNILDSFLYTKNFDELNDAYLRYKDKLPELNNTEFFEACNSWSIEDVIFNFEMSANGSLQNYKDHV